MPLVPVDDDHYDAKVKVFGDYIDHHVKEEAGEMLPKVKKTVFDLEALATRSLCARKRSWPGRARSAMQPDWQTPAASAAVRLLQVLSVPRPRQCAPTHRHQKVVMVHSNNRKFRPLREFQMTVSLSATPVATWIKRATLAATLTVATSAAFALPSFTFDPTAAGLAGPAFTADNLLISNYSTVLASGSDFTQTGYLSIGAAQLGGSTFAPSGLNQDYGIYIAYEATGTNSVTGNPGTVATAGELSSLSYTIYGYNGTATFGFSGNTPTESASGEVALASGTLINGTVATVPSGTAGGFSPSANIQATFSVLAPAFFQSPVPFYDLAFAAFSNTTSQVQTFDGGFRISQGGGSINFEGATVVPEPSSYALLLAGLGAVGFMLRRRRM